MRRAACLVLAMSVLTGGIVAAPISSQAAPPTIGDSFGGIFNYRFGFGWILDLPSRHANNSESEAAASVAGSATYFMPNYGATTEPGEPSFNGKMKKTIWGELTPEKNSRVVIYTFGSDFDTALAVHTGNKVNKLKKVTFNDNFKVPGLNSYSLPGLSNKQSLVQFDANKGTRYSVQLGSKTGDEGDFFASVFVFPKTGGLSAFLAEVAGNPLWGGRDFNCGFGTTEPLPCEDATFLLHNSTDKTLKVFASSDLGPGVTAPGPIKLKPGKAALVTFTFEAGFDKTTVRTVAGNFMFEAKKGSTVISRAGTRAVVVVKNAAASPDVLQATRITPTVQSNWTNSANDFTVTLKNTGSAAAKGCHARADRYEYLRAIWQRLKSGKPKGDPNTPFNIPAGKSQTFRLTAGSMEYRDADPQYPAHIVIDCATTQSAPLNLMNSFDFSASGNWKTATLATGILSPGGDTLKVPGGGQSSFKTSAKSTGTNGTIVVRPIYARPFTDTADTLYSATVCQLKKKNGSCMAPPTSSVQYDTKKNVTRYFKAFVDAPANDPGFSATERRVFLEFLNKRPAGVADGFSEITVAAESIAPKLN